MSNEVLQIGDFITYVNKPGAFGIYEGVLVDSTTQYLKSYSLVLYYEPNKYVDTEDGYKAIEYLDIATDSKRCEKTIDTNKENYWWHVATSKQKEEAINKLKEKGYLWDEENFRLINIETGEIVKKIYFPKIEYKGEIIKPICEKFKNFLKNFVKTKTKPSTTSYTQGGYNRMYEDYYGCD